MSSDSVTGERLLPIGVRPLESSSGKGSDPSPSPGVRSPESPSLKGSDPFSGSDSTSDASSSSYSPNSSVSCAGTSTCVARTTGSRSSGSGGTIGGSGWYGTRTVAVVRRTRSVVLAAACRVAVRMLAIDAPVRRRTPASIRNTHRMCEPAVEKNLAEAQKSDSPTRPPWCCR